MLWALPAGQKTHQRRGPPQPSIAAALLDSRSTCALNGPQSATLPPLAVLAAAGLTTAPP